MKPAILVIRGGAIGDFVLTLPAIRLLREAFPNAHIEILGYKHIVSIACGRYYADASRSIEYGPLAAFFVPNGELPQDLVEYFGGFQQVVSYLFDPDKIFEGNLRRCGVKHYIHVSPKIDDSAHASLQLALPLQQLALYLEGFAAELFPLPEDRSEAESLLAGKAGPFVALHPGSGSERKNWPVERWADVAAHILDRSPEATLILVGGEADFERLDRLQAILPPGRVHELRNVSLPILAALLSKCRLFLGHDSGISHLAAASGAPCVLLFGPTDPGVWAPTNPGVTVVSGPKGALEEIFVQDVERAIEAKFSLV